MTASIDYQSLLQELKERFSPIQDNDPIAKEVGNRMCRTLTYCLDMNQPLSMEEMIQQLEQKWRLDGLLR